MKNKKYYIALNDREYAEIISSLINKRNSLIRLGNSLYIRKISNRISNSSCTVSFSYDTVFSFSHLIGYAKTSDNRASENPR